MERSLLNSPVAITALRFGRDMRAYPQRMEWQGKTYHFTSHGVRLNIRRGQALSSTMTCSDGKHTYRLRETDGSWTLVSIG